MRHSYTCMQTSMRDTTLERYSPERNLSLANRARRETRKQASVAARVSSHLSPLPPAWLPSI